MSFTRIDRRLAVASVLSYAAFLASPASLRPVVLQAFGWGTTISVIVVTRRFPRHERRPWQLLWVAGIGSLASGIVKVAIVQPRPDGSIPLPSEADALLAMVYLSILGCELLLIHRRLGRGERGHLLDSLLVGAAIGFGIWAFALEPYVVDASQPLSDRVVSTAYAAVALMIVIATLRLAVGGGARPPAYHRLAGAMALFLATDLIYTIALAHDLNADTSQYFMIPIFGLLAAAALHPSATEIASRPIRERARLTRGRVTMLTGALLMSPTMLVFYETHGRRDRLISVFVGSAAISILVLARIVGLIRAQERSHDREVVLRQVGERFLVAADLNDIAVILLDGARGLLPGDALIDVTHRSPADMVETIASSGGSSARFKLVMTLSDDDTGAYQLAVGTDEPLDADVTNALEALARDAGLAFRALTAVQHEIRQRSERRFQALIENADDVVVVVSATGHIDYISPAGERLVGRDAQDVVGSDLAELFRGAQLNRYLDRARDSTAPLPKRVLEVETCAAGGSPVRTVELTLTDLRHEPGVDGIVLNGRDVTERQALEQSLRHQARHDHLTGLPNRAYLMERLTDVLGTAAGTPVALLFLDLDDFKDVNDSLGHESGDQLLVAVAERLGSAIRVGDTAARIGGDEFAVLIPDALGEASVLEVAHRIIESVARPQTIAGREMTCAISIGVAIDYDRTATPEVLLRNADVAMYRAKERGKGRVETFEEHLHTSAFHRFEMRTGLARAIEHDELRVHYQPIVDLTTTQVIGAEALVRWEHPHKGLLGPMEFIPVAEATGLIVDLGRWVMSEATRQTADWSRRFGVALNVSVNVSVRQLDEPGLAEEVLAAVRAADIPTNTLCVEITESIFAADQRLAIEQLNALRAEGIRVAIDDFGTGYSSLTQIQDYPFDVLKIDKSFVDRLGGPTSRDGVVRTILRLADDLGVTTVAEGIEHEPQHDVLVALGCAQGQGYLYSKPVIAADFEDLLLRNDRIFDRTPNTALAPKAATSTAKTT